MRCTHHYLNYVNGYWLTLWMHWRFLHALCILTLSLIHSIDITMERLQRWICLANYWFICCWIIQVADFYSWFFIDKIRPYKALSFSFHFIDYNVATHKYKSRRKKIIITLTWVRFLCWFSISTIFSVTFIKSLSGRAHVIVVFLL